MLRRGFSAFARHALACAAVAAAAYPQICIAETAGPRDLPAFLDKSRLSHLEEARAALAAIAAREAATVSFTGRDEAEKIMTSAGDVQRRAEAERLLAAEVRARAEALSERFSAEIAEASREKAALPAAQAKAAPSGKPAALTTASVEPRAAQAMQRAAEALTRARRDLEEATRRASAPDQQRNSASWQKAKAEIDEARRRAGEAVEQAQKAIDEQKELAAPTVASADAPAATTAPAARDPRMVPPYALGGMTK